MSRMKHFRARSKKKLANYKQRLSSSSTGWAIKPVVEAKAEPNPVAGLGHVKVLVRMLWPNILIKSLFF